MKYYKSNYEIAISSLNSSRSDHYDGINAIYRLAAVLNIPVGTSADGLQRLIQSLVKDLLKLEVKANRILVHGGKIEIDFYPKGFQMVMSRGQYAGLVFEFAEFLNNSSIQNLYIHSRFFLDDPDDSVKGVSNDMVNFFPEFNQDCFGSNPNEPIKIININPILESIA